MKTETKISLDSYHLGQDIREILARLEHQPKITKVLDDGVIWYESPKGTDFKTQIEGHDVVAIRGSELNVGGLGTVGLNDTPDHVIRTLGKPSKVQDLPDTLIQSRETWDKEDDQIIRLEYQIGKAHIKICFFGQPGIREIVLRLSKDK